MADNWIEILDPKSAGKAALAEVSPRPLSLSGKKVGFLSNQWVTWNKHFIPALADVLKHDHGVADFSYYLVETSSPADGSVLDKLGRENDAIVNSIGY